MRFLTTRLAGVTVVEPEPLRDMRGSFARLYCPEEFAKAGIGFAPAQVSLSQNSARHTLRGLHYCLEPEAKLVRCTRGRVFDVALDLRRDGPSFGSWFGLVLEPDSASGLLIPGGVAHGFITLEPNSDVLYQIDRIFRPGFDAGVRWNDPAFGIAWPAAPEVVNERDATFPDFA